MTQAEIRLIEEGWSTLVAQLGFAEATKFVMLLDRRTGGGLQHIQHLWITAFSETANQEPLHGDQPVKQFDAR